MTSRLLAFVQVELPAILGAQDGRWLLHRPAGAAEQVVILRTTRTPAAGDGRPRQRRLGRRPSLPSSASEGAHESAGPHEVLVTDAMVIDGTPLPSQQEAEARLASLTVEDALEQAFEAVTRLWQAHRIAAADHRACNPDPLAATALWAGYGEGEELAEGRWSAATRLPWPPTPPKRRRRSAMLADAGAEERMAALLSGREQALICEELALRARSDLEAHRAAHCAIELERAYLAALAELDLERSPEMLRRRAELQQLHPDLAAAAAAAIAAPSSGQGLALGEDLLRHALQRLEAALRARRLLTR